jgi:myo-inositol-1(or 4)-monophosphatase
MTPDLDRWLDDAVDIARFAGARADSMFHKRDLLKIEHKEGSQNYVTAADRKTEELILEELSRRYPDHAFLSEEGLGKVTAPAPGQPLWVVDPIDGTHNFIRGVPLWAVSIALVLDGEPLVGVIACPRQDEVFMAAKGKGAHLYTTPIHASKTTSLGRAQVALGAPRRSSPVNVVDLEEKLMEAKTDVRRVGSACVAMAWTACGRFDGYVENRLAAWDLAAGLLIMREAGVLTHDVTAGPWLDQPSPLWCAAPGVADELKKATGL